MEMVDISVEARNVQAGYALVTVGAGKVFKIETSPQGEDILNLTVPEGKVWSVQMNVQITETDEE